MLYTALCAIARDEGPHLREWVLHHLAVGFEHIIVYDNGSREPVRQTLADFVAVGLVTVLDFPSRQKPQLSAYFHCLKNFRRASRWLAFVDIDEFILPLVTRDIRDFLPRYEQYAALAVHWMLFGSCGHLGRPASSVVRAYTHSLGLDPHIKCIVQPEKTIKPLSPHHFAHAEGSVCVNEDAIPVFGALSYPVAGKIRINHYYYKSQQDFEEKMARGFATPIHGQERRSLSEFYAQSRQLGSPDVAALPFAVQAERLGRLPVDELARLTLHAAAAGAVAELDAITALVGRGQLGAALGRFERAYRYQRSPELLVLGAGLYYAQEQPERCWQLLAQALQMASGQPAQECWVLEQIRQQYLRQGEETKATALGTFIDRHTAPTGRAEGA